jgi:hypothetical protein
VLETEVFSMRATVTATEYSGRKVTAEGVFGGWSDQVAFERRFAINATVLQRLGESFNEEGELLPGADPAKIRSEWLAFVAFRVLKRESTETLPDSFDAWIDALEDLDINVETEAEDEAEVPTSAIALAPPSS